MSIEFKNGEEVKVGNRTGRVVKTSDPATRPAPGCITVHFVDPTTGAELYEICSVVGTSEVCLISPCKIVDSKFEGPGKAALEKQLNTYHPTKRRSHTKTASAKPKASKLEDSPVDVTMWRTWSAEEAGKWFTSRNPRLLSTPVRHLVTGGIDGRSLFDLDEKLLTQDFKFSTIAAKALLRERELLPRDPTETCRLCHVHACTSTSRPCNHKVLCDACAIKVLRLQAEYDQLLVSDSSAEREKAVTLKWTHECLRCTLPVERIDLSS